jgi:hypothetical protein
MKDRVIPTPSNAAKARTRSRYQDQRPWCAQDGAVISLQQVSLRCAGEDLGDRGPDLLRRINLECEHYQRGASALQLLAPRRFDPSLTESA